MLQSARPARLFPHPSISWVLLFPLLLFVFVRGILPAWTGMSTDFPNYYTAARIVLEHGNVTRMYDDTWFQEQILRHGINQSGKFSPFPPPTALVLTPLAYCEPQTALRAFTVFNVLLLLASLRCLSRILAVPIIDTAVFLLLSGIGLCNCFRFGQLYIAVSAGMIIGYYCYREGKQIAAGIVVGLLIPVKYFPLVVLLFFLVNRDWRIVVAACATVIAEIAVSISILGWQVHGEFVNSVLGSHLTGHFGAQNPYSSLFQSWNSLLLRLFVADPVSNPHPIVDSPALHSVLLAAIVLSCAGAVVAAALQLNARARTEAPLLISLAGIGILTIAPGTATYHYVLLWLPVALLLKTAWKQGRKWILYGTLAFYAMIGFIPYALFRDFPGNGLQNILSFPRLFLVTLLFLISVTLARRTVHTATQGPAAVSQ